MNKTNKAPIPYSLWAAIVGFSLSIINDFGDYIPFLKGHEIDLILLVIIVITGDQLNQRGSLEGFKSEVISAVQNIDSKHLELKQELISEIRNIDIKTLEVIRNERIGIVTQISIARIFDDFVGDEYYAFNAPLQYENENLGDRLQFHVRRYKNVNFKVAHYYYPIFSCPDKRVVREWMAGINGFYQNLMAHGQLTENEKKKIIFYIPTKQYDFSPALNISYFIGKKNRGFEAIVYIHNEIFMDIQRRKPKIMLTIYDDKVIDLLRDHRADAITSTRNKPRIQTIIGIDDFLTYLQEELEKMALLD